MCYVKITRMATRGLSPANHFNKWHLSVSKGKPGGHGTAVCRFALDSILITLRNRNDRNLLSWQLSPKSKEISNRQEQSGTESNWSSVLGKLPQLVKLEPGLYLPFSRVSVLFVLLTARSYSCVKYVTSRVRKRDTTCDVSSFQWKQFQISFLFHFAVVRRAIRWMSFDSAPHLLLPSLLVLKVFKMWRSVDICLTCKTAWQAHLMKILKVIHMGHNALAIYNILSSLFLLKLNIDCIDNWKNWFPIREKCGCLDCGYLPVLKYLLNDLWRRLVWESSKLWPSKSESEQ